MGGKKKKKKKGKKKRKEVPVFYDSDEEPNYLFICDHLKTENAKNQHLVTSDKYYSHFTCGICNQIVMEPRECSKCQQMFCKLCINKWVSNVVCPSENRCEDPKYEKIHKFELEILQDLRFQCKVKGCSQQLKEVGEEGYTYEKALQHQKLCKNIPQLCRLQCGEKFLDKEMTEHQKICTKLQNKYCEKCNIPMKMDPHDCIEEMKQYLKDINIKHEKLKEDFGINDEIMNLQCSLGHHLRVQYGLIRECGDTDADVPSCHICGEVDLHMHHHFFRCEGMVKEQVPHNYYDQNDRYVEGTKEVERLCIYSICRLCALQTCDLPRLKEEQISIKPSIHEHKLKKIEPNDEGEWVCHMASKKGDGNQSQEKNQCLSGICGPNQTKNIQGFVSTHDENFYMCLKCVLQLQCPESIKENPEFYNNNFWNQDHISSLGQSMDQLMDEYLG